MHQTQPAFPRTIVLAVHEQVVVRDYGEPCMFVCLLHLPQSVLVGRVCAERRMYRVDRWSVRLVGVTKRVRATLACSSEYICQSVTPPYHSPVQLPSSSHGHQRGSVGLRRQILARTLQHFEAVVLRVSTRPEHGAFQQPAHTHSTARPSYVHCNLHGEHLLVVFIFEAVVHHGAGVLHVRRVGERTFLLPAWRRRRRAGQASRVEQRGCPCERCRTRP